MILLNEEDDPIYFKRLFEKYNLTADDVVYFDRTQEFADCGKSLGIPTHWYDPEKKDLGALKKFLDENL